VEVVDWIHLVHERDEWWVLVNTIMNFWVPQKAENIWSSSVTISFSRMTLLHEVG
jgi:hypothetical protein